MRELAELTNAVGEKAAPKSGPAAGATSRLTLHGRGAGDDGPIITSQAKDLEQLRVTLQDNMAFIYKPSSTTADKKYTCVWGDTVVVTPAGGRRLGNRPHELAVSSG